MTPTVRTRHVTITSPQGDRLKNAIWSRPKKWARYKDVSANLKQAITYAREVLRTKRIGTIVYIGNNPIYQAKWGGGREFTAWKQNPVADYWRRKITGKK